MIPEAAIPSPNIWRNPGVYELENRAVDPERVIETAMERIRTVDGAHVLDIGCGTGFHLPRFAERARRVTGVEPHPRLAEAARRRVRGLPGVEVLDGVAQRLPVPDAVVEVAHARWAYFFGPGCEPGLAELDRVMRRGGVAFVIDNDATRSTFGGWFRRSLPSYDPAAVERFWVSRGFTREALTMRWDFTDRRAFEAVVRIEFPSALAEEIIASHPGLTVDYAVNLWWRRY
ncbi:class I SAM-dependent methyltransferase [Nocardiopsis algeriensis]|uniref:Ubiquinone/menaquinone biosynthesis C-methylase UbiE n=1 Tax=Nocardiopsis algeriensis TaxID=1478215 RepID=A0A841IRS4_9ACTN|nr:class I SAM-dependent methyltransferase [Nocardiopsis algeriensis]MBB6120910.1 ubiquinone/menaquinone biosynthesis C-methylase UbiE [Nocardiopsis algeriensis]